jgi:hypothetical protein
MKINYKLNWTDKDFEFIENTIINYFKGKEIVFKGKSIICPKTFDELDNIVGFAFTSANTYAGYWVCNGDFKSIINPNYNYNGFYITEDNKILSIAWNDEENQLLTNIGELMTKEEVLQQCKVEGNIIKLPPNQLERKLYQEVAAALKLIGGKWEGGKIAGFVFNEDPTELLEQIANGEKRNLKKEFQYFPTPDVIADQLVWLAKIEPQHKILEPSAGQGAIIKAIQRVDSEKEVYAFELMEINRTFLSKIPFVKLNPEPNFLEYSMKTKFDRIIANPPFSKNQDIDHIYKMFNCLTDNGILVSIASKHWQQSTNKKETDFRTFLNYHNAEIEEIPAGKFKESGTMISSCIIIIKK